MLTDNGRTAHVMHLAAYYWQRRHKTVKQNTTLNGRHSDTWNQSLTWQTSPYLSAPLRVKACVSVDPALWPAQFDCNRPVAIRHAMFTVAMRAAGWLIERAEINNADTMDGTPAANYAYRLVSKLPPIGGLVRSMLGKLGLIDWARFNVPPNTL